MNSRHSSQKKVCGLSVSPFKTDHWGVTETDCSHSQYTCHAKTHVCLSGNVRHWCSIWSFISNSPVSERALHANTREMSNERSLVHMPTCRRAGKKGMGKEGKEGVGNREEQQERKRNIKQGDEHRQKQWERVRVTSPLPVGAEYTVCVRGICHRVDT